MKKIIIIILASCLVMFEAVQAFAAPFINSKSITVDYVDVVNPYMTPLEKKDMLKRSMSLIRASGIKARLGTRYNVQDPFLSKRMSIDNTTDRFREEFELWQRKVSNLRKRNRLLIVLAPPWIIGNTLDSQGWPKGGTVRIGGQAETGTISRGCIAVASVSSYQIGGKSMKGASETITLHEIGHCLGADHDDSQPNIMTKYIPSTGGPLFYTSKSLGEMSNELN